jgi:hypothetical protein
MIPIAPTVFWGPMAYAIMGGLAIATVLTLVFLPALYVAWFRIKKPGPDAGQTMDLGDFELLGRSEAVKDEDALEPV